MTPPKYLTARSVEEAVSLLSQYGGKANLVSGGTDFVMQLKRGEALPECLIRLGEIRELDFITHDETSGLRIGGLTPIARIANSSLIRSKFSILAQAAGIFG